MDNLIVEDKLVILEKIRIIKTTERAREHGWHSRLTPLLRACAPNN